MPKVATKAKVGDYVLAPARTWVEEAAAHGVSQQTFIFYGAWMREPGAHESRIESLTGAQFTLPNGFIAPIRRGERVQPGALVLTSWASGSGLQRAIVVDGGTPESPKVRYLDMAIDNPSGWGEKDDTLPPNTFHQLEAAGKVGATAACLEGAGRVRVVITGLFRERLVGLAFAGKLKMFLQRDCVMLPLQPKLREGETVMVPIIGRYREARVKRIESDVGRVWARYDVAGERKETAFALLDAAAQLP
jgi:hypothetical protein